MDRKGPYVQTYFGMWWPLDPRIEDIKIGDFLSLQNVIRFGGHTHDPYSVAAHSVYVAELLATQGHDRQVVWEGLTHDAHEIYPPGDVLGPLLRAVPVLQELERSASRVVREYLRWATPDGPMRDAVKQADRILLATERRDVIGMVPECDWGLLPEPLAFKVCPNASLDFVRAWNRLRPIGVGAL